jgi:hypothetical protein
MQITACVHLNLQALDAEKRMLGLQSDFAMVFEASDAGDSACARPYTYWLGRVERMIKVVGRRKVEYREPVDLDKVDGTILVVAHWYKECDGRSDVYTFTQPDHKCYDLQHVLAPVHLTSDKTPADDGSVLFEYFLSEADKAVLDAAVADIARSESHESSDRPAGRKRKRSKASQRMAEDGRVVQTLTSARGRTRHAVGFEHR